MPKQLRSTDDIEQARAMARDLHEALAEAKLVMRELRQAKAEGEHLAERLAAELLGKITDVVLAEAKELRAAMDKAITAVQESAAELAGVQTPEAFLRLVITGLQDAMQDHLARTVVTQVAELIKNGLKDEVTAELNKAAEKVLGQLSAMTTTAAPGTREAADAYRKQREHRRG